MKLKDGDYELEIGDWIQYVAVNGYSQFGKVVGFQRNMDEQQIYMNLSLMNGNTDSIPKKWDWVKTRPNEAFLLDIAYNKRNKNPNDLQQRKRNYTLSTDEPDTDKPEIQYICDMYNELPDDKVNHPSHYNYGDIEVIDFIEQVTKHYNSDVAYHIGNAIKYLARSPHKNGKEDIAKAKWYIERAYEKLE